MFRIGEFSKLTQVSIRMLRYYDELGLLTPAEIDRFTGYRLYSASQIATLQKIVLLRDVECSTAEIAAALRHWDPASVSSLLARKKAEITDRIRREQDRIKKIEAAVTDIQNQALKVHYNVLLKPVPAYKIISLRQTIPDHFCEGQLWEKLCEFVSKEHVELLPGRGDLAIFHNEECPGEGVDVEVGLHVRTLKRGKDGFLYRETEPVDTMACVMVYGPYTNIDSSFCAFAHWLEAHQQYEICGPVREVCHVGPPAETNPQKFLTEIQTPVRRKAPYEENRRGEEIP